MKNNPNGASFEITVDRVTRTYRDTRAIAIEAALFLKERNPTLEVAVAAGFELGLPKLRELAARDGAVLETEEDIVAARAHWPPETQTLITPGG